jgi:hypothetical protein
VPQTPLPGPPRYIDVTGDNFIAPDDVLAIINVINAGSVSTPSFPGAATFVELDQTTRGNWQSKYGAGGYAINSHVTSVPAYAELAFTGGLTDLYDSIVAYSTTDPRGLVKPGASDRIISSWTGDHGFTLHLNLTDGQTHRVALYMDEGINNRHQKLEVLDAKTGAVLDTQTLDDFAGGVYLVWNLRGDVIIRFSNLANGLNAVLSGVFFD